MPDKQLLRLLGEDKRYIYRAVAWMLTGSLCSIGFTACLCYGLHLLLIDAKDVLLHASFRFGSGMRGAALSCHDSRRGGAGQAGAQREEKPAGAAVRKAPASRRAGDENRKNGRADPAGHGGHRAAGSVLFLLPAAVFLRHALAAAAVWHLRFSSIGAWRRCCWPACR